MHRVTGDRFVSARETRYDAPTPQEITRTGTWHALLYRKALADALFPGWRQPSASVLDFSSFAGRKMQPPVAKLLAQEKCRDRVARKTGVCRISSTPTVRLDAPDVRDDYYGQQMDFHGALRVLAVTLHLGACVFLRHPRENAVVRVATPTAQNTKCVRFHATEPLLMTGATNGRLAAHKIERPDHAGYPIRTQDDGSVSALDWQRNSGDIVVAGYSDGAVYLCDLRSASVTSLSMHGSLKCCGVAWSRDGNKLAAGDNDGCVRLWDLRAGWNAPPLAQFFHGDCGVRALDWCPWESSMLATGGGMNDQTVRVWDTGSLACVGLYRVGTQVCALKWLSRSRALLTANGSPLRNLCLRHWPDLKAIDSVKCGNHRLLDLAIDDADDTAVTLSADDTVAFWQLTRGDDNARRPRRKCRSGKLEAREIR